MKTIPKARIGSIASFRNELNIQADLDHPHIARVHDSFEDRRHVYLVMELCRGGDVCMALGDAERFEELDACALMAQVMQAVRYIHDRRVVHRDLKLDNFLLKDMGLPLSQNTLKLVDFGMARAFTPGQQSLQTKCGTIYYTAPEIFRVPYDESCDVWSCGVVFYILLCGYPPFLGESEAEILGKASKGHLVFDDPVWDHVTPQAKLLITQMCKLNPAHRFTAAQVAEGLLQAQEASRQATARGDYEPKAVVGNFRRFQRMNVFQKAALHIAAHNMEDRHTGHLRDLFRSLDKNGDGVLSIEEMRAGCLQAEIKLEDCDGLFASIDTDCSGTVSYTEFISALIGKRQLQLDEACWDAFRVVDRDGDGRISLAELRQVLAEAFGPGSPAALKQAQAVFQQADLDGDGLVDFREFVAMLRSAVAS